MPIPGPSRRAFVAGLAATVALRRLPAAGGDAASLLVIALADLHSAHEAHAPLLARVDRVLAGARGVPALVAINGDLFERGNAVALRDGGALDLALVRDLRRRAPVVLNVGNHEGALGDLGDALRRLREAGAAVVSTIRDRATGRPLAEPVAVVRTGGVRVAVAGAGTDDLATYRAPVRDAIAVPDSPAAFAAILPALAAARADVDVLLSHDGLADDRRTLDTLPDGSLLVGGHDHLRLAHRAGRTLYLHPGYWGASFAVVERTAGADGAGAWRHRFVDVSPDGPGDRAAARRVREARGRLLEPGDRAIVGRLPRALAPRAAALLAVDAVRAAAGCDAAFVGNTTFGAGLPAGPVTRHAFDACVRFDGPIARAEVDGATLRALLARANQDDATPFARRTGEYLVGAGPGVVEDGRRYRVAVNAFTVADPARARRMLGVDVVPSFEAAPGVTLVAAVLARLAQCASSPARP